MNIKNHTVAILFVFVATLFIWGCDRGSSSKSGSKASNSDASYKYSEVPQQLIVGSWTYQLDATISKVGSQYKVTASIYDIDGKMVGNGFVFNKLITDNGFRVYECVPTKLLQGPVGPHGWFTSLKAEYLGYTDYSPGQGIDVIIDAADIGLPSFLLRANRIVVSTSG